MQIASAFQGKRAFVSGGSSGIGAETARLLVEAGASVAIAARGPDRLERVIKQLRELSPNGQRVLAFPLDVRDREATKEVARRVHRELSGIDLVINSAGVARPGRVGELPDSVYVDMMATNYFGAVHVTRAFLPFLTQSGTAHISFVSSLVGFMGVYGYTAYSASKFALVGFAECLRQELVGTGVSVSLLYPGDTDTPQLREENRYKPPETKAISRNCMSARSVASAYLQGMAARRLHIVPGFDGKLTHLLYRLAPGLVHQVIDRRVRQAQQSSRKRTSSQPHP